MAINAALQNPQSGEIKFGKVGFSWALFFLSGILGIVLFKRKLVTWGTVFLIMSVAGAILPFMSGNAAADLLKVLLLLLQIILAIVMGVKGNEMTAKALLARGWRFSDPTSDMTRFAKMKWHIFEMPTAPPPAVAQT
jgi:hypothetical protein